MQILNLYFFSSSHLSRMQSGDSLLYKVWIKIASLYFSCFPSHERSSFSKNLFLFFEGVEKKPISVQYQDLVLLKKHKSVVEWNSSVLFIFLTIILQISTFVVSFFSSICLNYFNNFFFSPSLRSRRQPPRFCPPPPQPADYLSPCLEPRPRARPRSTLSFWHVRK